MTHSHFDLGDRGGSGLRAQHRNRDLAFVPRGRATVEFWGPYFVEDPEKADALLRDIGLESGGLLDRQFLAHSTLEKAIRSGADTSELEGLLLGGGMYDVRTGRNLVVAEGIDDVLDKYFKGSAYTAAHYMGLTDSTPTPADGDTLASHAGWAEFTAYSEASRPQITWGSVSSKSLDNSANKAVFTINAASQTVGGLFVCTVASGTAGTLYNAVAFSEGDRTNLQVEDTLNVTITFTGADDGV